MKTPRPLVLLALCAACGAPASDTSAPATAPVAEPAAQPVARPAAEPVAEPAVRVESTDEAPLRFVAQETWVEEQPSSGMRAAQYRLPGEVGDASLVVYYFGRSGGSLEANLERWAGQFEQPDGSDSLERMQRSDRQVGGLDVVLVDVAGTYVAETSPGSGERVHEEDWRMLAAVIDAPQGAYYAKLVGPVATVAAHAARFDAFLDGLR